MSSFSFGFQDPRFLFLLIPAFAIILIPFLLLPARSRKTAKKIVPVVLHLVIAMLLVLILSGFHFVRSTSEKSIMLMLDFSNSMDPVKEQVKENADQIIALVDKQTPVGVVVFGYDQLYSLKFSSESRLFEVEELDADGTDIEAALEFASFVFPTDRAKQIILLSDGKETDGRAHETAQFFATQGIRVDCMYFDTTQLSTPEVQIASFSVPDGVYLNEPLALNYQIKSNTETTAQLDLYDNDTLLESKELKVVPGTEVLEYESVADKAGVHNYRLELTVQSDTILKNNTAYGYLKVTGKPSVLILSDQPKKSLLLEDVLSKDHEVKLCSSSEAPKSIGQLCDYDQIVLSNVDFASLPRGYDELLESYVSLFGRSLLVAGGPNTYMFGNMKNTKIEEMLPVSFEYNKSSEGEPVALMLVLDCSRSMSNQGNYLSVAKQGAIKCVEAMSENDYIGLITFHSTAEVKSPLIQATKRNKDALIRIISELTTDQKTYYTRALTLATDQMRMSDAKIRHIMFLSDGQPSDDGYDRVVKAAAQDQITVSTIGLGYSSEILEELAGNGGGRYYYVESAQDLPSIMLSETKQMSVSPLVNENFSPVIARESKLTATLGAAKLPELTGYLGTTLKDDATVYLTTPDGYPIYAACKYGSGKIACFTSDLNGHWSSEFLKDDVGQALVGNMVDMIVPESHHESSFVTDISVGGRRSEIVVKTYDQNPLCNLSVSVDYKNEQTIYAFYQTEPGVYKLSIPTNNPGHYELMILQTDQTGQIVDFQESAICVSYSTEYNVFDQSGYAFLESLCSYSGGIVSQDAKELVRAKVSPIRLVSNPMVWFAVICVILFLADLAIRLLRWKDIQILFQKSKKTKSK